MSKIKRFILLLVITLFVSLLVSCEFKVLKDLEVKIIEDKIEIYEGEDLPEEKLQIIATYTNNKKEEISLNHKKLSFDYNKHPKFDHNDLNDNEVIQEVTFKYNNKTQAKIQVTTKRLVVTGLSLLEYGQTEYKYGEKLNVSGYRLLANYANRPNQIIDLSEDMVDLDSLNLKPNQLGTYLVDVRYNGFKLPTGLPLFVLKGEQVITAGSIELVEFTRERIEIKPISNALYAFLPKGNQPDENSWQLTNIFEATNIEEDYTVFVKLAETDFALESNVVSKDLKYNGLKAAPEVLMINKTSVVFKDNPLFDLVMIDDENNNIAYANIVRENGYFEVTKLLPNHKYRFAFVEKDSNIIYEESIFKQLNTNGELIDYLITKEAKDIISFVDNQAYTYNNESFSFIYKVSEEFASSISVDVKYFLHGEVVANPVNVGTYEVIITNNFNNDTLISTMTINPRTDASI